MWISAFAGMTIRVATDAYKRLKKNVKSLLLEIILFSENFYIRIKRC